MYDVAGGYASWNKLRRVEKCKIVRVITVTDKYCGGLTVGKQSKLCTSKSCTTVRHKQKVYGNLQSGALYLNIEGSLVYPVPICRNTNMRLSNYERLAQMKLNLEEAEFLCRNLTGCTKEEEEYVLKVYQ
eukprot:4715127-Ditylum_brightwellii.AAC.1